MHPNSAFRQTSRDENLAFAAARGFGVLTCGGDPWPLAAHIPFVPVEGGMEFHLVRSNPICGAVPCAGLLAVSGPDGYISPDWYGMPDQVPTWNYLAVHLRGRIVPAPDLRAHLDRLSEHFETRLAPKPVWRADKMTPDALDRMMRAIIPFRLMIEDVQGTWKFGQNKPEAARLAAADHVAPELAALMRGA